MSTFRAEVAKLVEEREKRLDVPLVVRAEPAGLPA